MVTKLVESLLPCPDTTIVSIIIFLKSTGNALYISLLINVLSSLDDQPPVLDVLLLNSLYNIISANSNTNPQALCENPDALHSLGVVVFAIRSV